MINKFYIFLLLLSFLSCKDDDPIGPEKNCHLNDQYNQLVLELSHGKAFDVRLNPPAEIKSGNLGNKLTDQWLFNTFGKDTSPFPYSEYYIDTISFIDTATAAVHFNKSDSSRIYAYSRDDCGMDLTSIEGELHLELTHGGEGITEQRYAIYDHSSREAVYQNHHFRVDTFSFIEFRPGFFSSYENIIAQFVQDHPGEYDTVVIELIKNRPRE